MKSIPTTYRDVEYRSRLEAKWAAFFDLIGWQHTYEPFDGDGYLPDFLIHGDAPLLVEVKPAVTDEQFCAPVEKIRKGLRNHWRHDVLIVGADPLPRLALSAAAAVKGTRSDAGDPFPAAGALDEIHAPWLFDVAQWCTCPACGQLGVLHGAKAFKSRPCGHHDDAVRLQPTQRSRAVLVASIQESWAIATNRVKWRAK